ncbi:S1C family serine protease [Paenibacillus physcomitrellae]|uniref:2-alkenal reductase n=1 Tax=Paenibacillus physcomitrellae TaxID=1619311 RepID=A0ABQ1GND2_9BACL|nr:trypsin-like peptidase domain-containing protein [Paenibacillus physcomitrellae]GGA46944.1 2-alkenal reductase [Paenibacillus physcomitrellae]
MGLFDDDFYSTKVTRKARLVKGTEGKWSTPRKSRKGLTTTQIAVICSVLSSVIAVVLFSYITGLPSSTQHAGALAVSSSGGDDYDEKIIQASAKVRPAVVSIVNYQSDSVSAGVSEDPSSSSSALGSGVIIKKDSGKAYIVTNNHVIEDTRNLVVVTADGVSKKAKIVGQDSVTDIALLEIDDEGITAVADIGDSTKLRLGETVIAVGNPLGLSGTQTSGIISYTHRIVPVSLNQDGVYDWEQEVIQTDAAINEGNSGGALADLNGKVIGINTMKIADTGVEGLGFAIPTDQVMKTVDELMKYGKISRPYLGVYSLDLDNPYSPLTEEQRQDLKLPEDVTQGVLVLEAHGPAAQAGLELNDVIVQLDKTKINSTLELRKYLYDEKKIGDNMDVTYYRGGKLQTTTLKLIEKPADAEANPDGDGSSDPSGQDGAESDDSGK